MKRKSLISFILLFLLNISWAAGFYLVSPNFSAYNRIPSEYTCDGRNISPALEWQNPPSGTKSFALVVTDPDATMGTWYHWIVYNIPATTHGFVEGIQHLPAGSEVAANSWYDYFYSGPCPPLGENHHYFFTLYALNTYLHPQQQITKNNIIRLLRGKILGTAELTGVYQRHSDKLP